MKRLFDTILGILCLIISLPLMIIVSIAIKVDSKGPIFFKSLRVGQHGKTFKMIKFRTMVEGTKLQETKKIKNLNKKITKIGHYLRRSSLDELPQLFNVLLGQMSIVGPRPAIKSQKNLIKKRLKFKIYQIKPGITGLAQINGRDSISEKKKLYFDYLYYKKYGIFLDIKIIFKTVFLVISNKNISH